MSWPDVKLIPQTNKQIYSKSYIYIIYIYIYMYIFIYIYIHVYMVNLIHVYVYVNRLLSNKLIETYI